jgi:hypothetical protein
VRRSEWIEKAIRNGLNDREAAVAANLAQEAGARWDPEPEPAEALTHAELDAIGSAAILAWSAANPGPEAPLAAGRAAVAKLRELAPQPAGPGRERKLAVPLLMCYRGVGGAGRVLYDIELIDGKRFRVRIDPDGDWVFRELLGYYNAPPAPAGWPAPTLAVPGKPETQPVGDHFSHIGDAWRGAYRGERACQFSGWWLPQPPDPPEMP